MEIRNISYKELCMRLLVVPCIAAYLILLADSLYVKEAASIEIPPEVEKKVVTLNKAHVEAERTFASVCSACHRSPDPAKPETAKPDCTKGISKEQLLTVQTYVSNVSAGRDLYESYCGRCHALIEPGTHTLDYWSKNLCTSDSCMVKRKLNGGEEQQVLLYLSAHAKRD